MMEKKLLGDFVKEERLRRNLSQNALAENVHVSLRTISDIESYTANPRLETLSLVSRYLNISLDSVIFYDKPPIDPYLKQIINELNDCTDAEKDLALHTLRGLLDCLRKQK